MGRVLLRVAAALAFIHCALTFAAAIGIFHSFSADSLKFAQHGFAFAFLAGLNLAIWQPRARSSTTRYFVHGSNVIFLAFYLVFAFLKPEAPHYVAVGILILLTFAGLVQEKSPPTEA
jgi:peptidoglycan/LPS O-acetylase OafA/YrhL